MIKKLSSLLSKFIPDDLSMKGVAKLDPRLRAFLAASSAAGFGYNEVRKFLSRLTDTAPGRSVRKEELSRRRGRGSMSASDILEQRDLQEQDRGIGVSPAAVGAAAGALASRLVPGSEEVLKEESEVSVREPEEGKYKSFYQRALELVGPENITDDVRPRIQSLGSKLEELESKGLNWNDVNVKKIVRAMQRLTGQLGIVGEEGKRFKEEYGDAPQGDSSNADAQFLQILENLGGAWNEFMKGL